MRIKAALALPALAVMMTIGCSQKTDANRANADSGQTPATETQIELTQAQARAGAQAQVMIPERRQTVTVTIPPGVTDGVRLRLKGQGAPGMDGTPGDFLIRIRVK